MLYFIKVHCVLKLLLFFISKSSLVGARWRDIRWVSGTVRSQCLMSEPGHRSSLLPARPPAAERPEPRPSLSVQASEPLPQVGLFSLDLLQRCDSSINNYYQTVSDTCKRFVRSYRVNQAAWQQLYLFLLPCNFLHSFWWANFTTSTNKVLVVILRWRISLYLSLDRKRIWLVKQALLGFKSWGF